MEAVATEGLALEKRPLGIGREGKAGRLFEVKYIWRERENEGRRDGLCRGQRQMAGFMTSRMVLKPRRIMCLETPVTEKNNCLAPREFLLFVKIEVAVLEMPYSFDERRRCLPVR